MFRRITHHPYLDLPDLGQPVTFTFNGQPLQAYSGDTVTSALLVNGIHILSRSFKFHRPRSVYDAQGQGPETLVTVDGIPNELADQVWVRQGMAVRSQNAWPSVNFDLMAINSWLVPLLPNLFYYKLFHRPKWLWPLAEKGLRRIAGLGEIDRQGLVTPSGGEDASEALAQPRYEKRYRFPDVCVVGGGPAGLAAAQAALEAAQRVLLIDDQAELGGHARYTMGLVEHCRQSTLNQLPAYQAVRQLVARLVTHPRLEVLTRTQVFGVYEDNLIAAQQGHDLFKIRAKAVVLAPGATDRHLVFENNDLPGILTARGVERLIAGHRLAPGENAIIVTCHDGGYHTALLMRGAGVHIQAIVDARPAGTPGPFEQQVLSLGIPIYREQTIHAAHGDQWVASITIGRVEGTHCLRSFACDLVVMAVGFKPQLNLLSAGRQQPRWDSQRQVLRVQTLPPGLYAAGDVNGTASFAQVYEEGWLMGQAAAEGKEPPVSVRSECDRPSGQDRAHRIPALPADIEADGRHHIICKCMDVTRDEVRCSVAEGFDAVETLKRYTSMGMGPCQGKQCYEAVARLAAQDTGSPNTAIPTTLRPPSAPVSFGVLAGRAPHLQPIQRTPMHPCHQQLGATFLDTGSWQRPQAYGDPHQEALHVRQHLGLIDISTLGKLEFRGPDALALLQFLLPGKYARLAVGRTRYSIMVGEDGILFEDGTLSCLAKDCYYLTTTTGNQEALNALFQWWLTVEPYEVRFRNLSSLYAAINVTGPTARDFLQPLVNIDLANATFPYMACRQAQIAGVPALMFRVGFTGELGYEIHFPVEYGESLWQYLLEQGAPFQLKPFGVETQRILRLEKGHLIPGVDTDALTHPYEAGVGFAVKDDKASFVGKAALAAFKQRGLTSRLVPFKLSNAQDPIPEDGVAAVFAGKVMGRVTSARRSPTLGTGIGLAWVAADLAHPRQEFTIRLGNGQPVQAMVLGQAPYDPEGSRLTS